MFDCSLAVVVENQRLAYLIVTESLLIMAENEDLRPPINSEVADKETIELSSQLEQLRTDYKPSTPFRPMAERESHSPSTSQVSVGSVAPTLTATLLPRHYDLTPITRNTSSAGAPAPLISPEEDDLHGEHLAMPDDISGPTLPPLLRNSSKEEPPDAAAGLPGPPIEFGKFYSFTSSQQYQAATKATDHRRLAASKLTPYQPSRDAVDEWNDDDLAHIFAARAESKNHRLSAPIAMDERQLSIPSLRLANQLNSDVASLTSMDDDESSLQFLAGGGADDGSLSSRGSSLYFPDEAVEGSRVQILPPRSVFTPSMMQLVAASRDDTDDDDGSVVAVANDNVEDEEDHGRRRKHQRREEALQWLQSVEASEGDLQEAASSKFLLAQTVPLQPSLSFHSLEERTESYQSMMRQSRQDEKRPLDFRSSPDLLEEA